jgi:hypothetical protein
MTDNIVDFQQKRIEKEEENIRKDDAAKAVGSTIVYENQDLMIGDVFEIFPPDLTFEAIQIFTHVQMTSEEPAASHSIILSPDPESGLDSDDTSIMLETDPYVYIDVEASGVKHELMQMSQLLCVVPFALLRQQFDFDERVIQKLSSDPNIVKLYNFSGEVILSTKGKTRGDLKISMRDLPVEDMLPDGVSVEDLDA